MLDRIEDYPTTLPPKDYTATSLTTPKTPIIKAAKAPFKVVSNPRLVRKNWEFFQRVYQPILQSSFKDDKDKQKWINSLSAGPSSLRRTHWEGLDDSWVLHESEQLPGYGLAGGILDDLGVNAFFRDVIRWGLPTRQPWAERKSKLKSSDPSSYFTSLQYCRGQSQLLPNESPYLVRILSVANLIYADEIQWLASQGGTVNVEADTAVWPDVGEEPSNEQDVRPYKLKVARSLMNWVFNCAYETNVEFVILHDGWTTIHFFIRDNFHLVVGPTMIPRYPYPGRPEQDSLSLAQAFIGIAHIANYRKKLNSAGTRAYLPCWDGIEVAPLETGAKKTTGGSQKGKKRKRTGKKGGKKTLPSSPGEVEEVLAV